LRDLQIPVLDHLVFLREQRRERGVELDQLLDTHLSDDRLRHDAQYTGLARRRGAQSG